MTTAPHSGGRPIQLQLSHGQSASEAGWKMLPIALGLVVGSILNSRVVRRTRLPTCTSPSG